MDFKVLVTIVALFIFFRVIKVARNVKREANRKMQTRSAAPHQPTVAQDEFYADSECNSADNEYEMEEIDYDESSDSYETFLDGFEEETDPDGRGFSNVKNEKMEANSSKSGAYFTYEDGNCDKVQARKVASDSRVDDPVFEPQSVDNEKKRPELNLQDPEELKKAVLYSEILKNPYN